LLDTTLLIKFVKLAAGRWFSQYTPPIKQDSHDITEILLKMALKMFIEWFPTKLVLFQKRVFPYYIIMDFNYLLFI
jgi:hypothetical protein